MIKIEDFKIREIVNIAINSLWPDLTDEIRLENCGDYFTVGLLKRYDNSDTGNLYISEIVDKEALNTYSIDIISSRIIMNWERASKKREFILYKEKRADVAVLYNALKEVGDDIGYWMLTPNKYIFDGLTPVQVIERGDIKLIWDLVYSLRSKCRNENSNRS